jgi:malate dehydrogenase (oxaloacetate-decarboxylating)
MANPTPEIDPELARAAGAAIIATGRSDYPNQVNNVLAFPGLFRGALDAKATKITAEMKLAAALALAAAVKNPTREKILPSPLEKHVAKVIAKAVREKAIEQKVVRPICK